MPSTPSSRCAVAAASAPARCSAAPEPARRQVYTIYTMSAIIDQHRTWAKVEDRLATESDPILRRNLELLLEHMKAEASLDMDALMATVSEHAKYQNFAQGGTGPVGKPAVQQF